MPTTRTIVTPLQGAATAFRRYAPELHRYLLSRIRHGAAVPDLLQEVFERFLRVRDLEVVRNPQAYLYTIASHVVSQARLRDEHNPVTYDSAVVDEAGERMEHALPDNMAHRLELAQDLNRALGQLPPPHQAVLLLTKRDGLSYQQVAEQTGLSVSTVTLYVWEARSRLKTILKRSGYGR
jgi:RNA polymerase sigma factor (sigma-70 family)